MKKTAIEERSRYLKRKRRFDRCLGEVTVFKKDDSWHIENGVPTEDPQVENVVHFIDTDLQRTKYTRIILLVTNKFWKML